jgi:protein-S-isoprenylcysteine O-methyltransferase Ste14
MSKCRVRLILWLIMAGVSICGGGLTDISMRSHPFPLWVRLLGLGGMLLAHFPLKRTGKLLGLMGGTEEWGCTTKLVTTDIYQCVRHPHHLGVGFFMTSLGLLIGYWWSFLFITVTQWAWVIAFLYLVEERELAEKFGDEYEAYRQRVPMLLADLKCVLRVLSKSTYPSHS